VKGPALKHPCKGKHRHYARSAPSNPNLARRGEKAQAQPTLVCTSLAHHIADIEHLRACDQQLKGHKAVGVDEVTKSMYAADLEANLQDLSARLTRMGYRSQPKRRIYMPKPGSETGHTLGISSCEDKIVELATKRVLAPLFEPLFEECSYGYRPQCSPHQGLDALERPLQQKRVNLLVEADIRGFFALVDYSLFVHPDQQAQLKNTLPAYTVGSLRANVQVECLVDVIDELVSSDHPREQLQRFTQALHEVFAFECSKKHMIQRQLGRLEPTPCLKYRADEVRQNMTALST
jgi:hypothetical protein